jgi:hypothetical protein
VTDTSITAATLQNAIIDGLRRGGYAPPVKGSPPDSCMSLGIEAPSGTMVILQYLPERDHQYVDVTDCGGTVPYRQFFLESPTFCEDLQDHLRSLGIRLIWEWE